MCFISEIVRFTKININFAVISNEKKNQIRFKKNRFINIKIIPGIFDAL